MSKSYWQKMSVRTAGDQKAIKSYFHGFCDDMTVESAEVLCDKETDCEKKLRAVMVDVDGTKRVATLSRNKRENVVKLERVRP